MKMLETNVVNLNLIIIYIMVFFYSNATNHLFPILKKGQRMSSEKRVHSKRLYFKKKMKTIERHYLVSKVYIHLKNTQHIMHSITSF